MCIQYDFERCCLQRPLSKQEMMFAYKPASGSFHEHIILSKKHHILPHLSDFNFINFINPGVTCFGVGLRSGDIKCGIGSACLK